MLALVTIGTLINYLDRTVISVAAPLLSQDLGLSAAVLGLAFSAFSWTYAAAQIPGGVVLDRLGVRLTYFLSVTLWSLCTLATSFAAGVASLVGTRLALGVAEAPAFPSNSRVLSVWFPQHERARATGDSSVGQYFGLAFLSPALFWIGAELGWRTLFVIVGIVGVLFGIVWLVLYRDPRSSTRVNQAELEYIAAGGGLGDGGASTAFAWQNIALLLRQRQVLGASIGQFASNSTLVFFLTWFPTYLATERQMAYIKVGFFCRAALSRGDRGRGRRWRMVRRTAAQNRVGERRPQGPNRLWIVPRLDDRNCERGIERLARRRGNVSSLLRSGNVQSRLDPHHGRRAEKSHWPDGWGVQPLCEPRRHRDTHRDRRRRGIHGVLRLGTRLHRSNGASRSRVVRVLARRRASD